MRFCLVACKLRHDFITLKIESAEFESFKRAVETQLDELFILNDVNYAKNEKIKLNILFQYCKIEPTNLSAQLTRLS